MRCGALQINALVAQLNAPPIVGSLLVNLLSTCCAATAIFAAGITIFVICLVLSGLSFVASISLTVASGILFSLSTFVAFAGGMIVIPAIILSGVGSIALAAVAIPYRVQNQKTTSGSDEDDAVTTEDLKEEGFVSVSSPSDKRSKDSSFLGGLWKRKSSPIDASLQPEAQKVRFRRHLCQAHSIFACIESHVTAGVDDEDVNMSSTGTGQSLVAWLLA